MKARYDVTRNMEDLPMAKSKTSTKSAPKATETKAPETVTLANIAKATGKNPKAVRARFRKLYNQDGTPRDPKRTDLPRPLKDAGSRWTFAASDRPALEALVGTVSDGNEE